MAAFHHIAAHELSDDRARRSSATCSSAAATPTPRRPSASWAARWASAPIDVGALTNAGPLEGITAVLATINRRYKLKNSGIKITGL